MSDTPRVMSDDRGYPLPEHTQHIVFEGADCVVMAPEDYEALFGVAMSLEREFNVANTRIAELEEMESTWRKGALRHNEVKAQLTATRQRVAELEEALKQIADYDKDSPRGEGICPYGCDTPHIARAALRKETP